LRKFSCGATGHAIFSDFGPFQLHLYGRSSSGPPPARAPLRLFSRLALDRIPYPIRHVLQVTTFFGPKAERLVQAHPI
jgi:hypothetical protein